ncbi:MAG: PrsW family intramembrane metalloprotease, partial [Eggerthellaceae bacterium]|nr:PrsW family intramembrane metalloprotease [Eggerthellaceae bacterium]
KYRFLNTVRHNPEFNYVFDGIVYAVAVALGFAALENVLYVFDGGIEVAISRAIFAVPGHAADGVVMGCFYGLARKYEMEGYKGKAFSHRVMALLFPILEHGIYDFSLSTGNETVAWFGLGLELVFIAIGMILVNRMSAHDQAISPAAIDQTPAPLYPAPVENPQQYTIGNSQSPNSTFGQEGWSYPDFGQGIDSNQTRYF